MYTSIYERMLYAIKLNIKLLFAVLSFVGSTCSAFVPWNRPTAMQNLKSSVRLRFKLHS